jgi:hypothetical protein
MQFTTPNNTPTKITYVLQYVSSVLLKHKAAIRPIIDPQSDSVFDHYPPHHLSLELKNKLHKYKHLTSLKHLRNRDMIMNFPDFLVSISEKDRLKEINECPAAEQIPIWFFQLTSFFSHVPDNHHDNPNRAKYDYRFPLKDQFKTDGITSQPFITNPSNPPPGNSTIEIWTDGSYVRQEQ